MNRCISRLLGTSFVSLWTAIVCVGLNSATAADSGRDALWGIPQANHYLTIRPPSNKLHTKNTSPSFTVTPQTPQPYAYGWFGQKASPSLYRHFGHQQNYTQWTVR